MGVSLLKKNKAAKIQIELTQERLLEMYYYLRLTRAFEERLRSLYRQGKIMGGVYLSQGQEAIPVGYSLAMSKEDVIAPSHRDMGAFMVRGISLRLIMANYLGKATGPTRGKDSNVHLGDIKLGVIGFVSHLADNLPIAAGLALSFKIRKEKRVALATIGDGGTSRGDFHEALNFSGVRQLPVVFICNNNRYAYSTPLKLQMAIENIADRAAAYGFEGIAVEGNDVKQVYKVAKYAIEKARKGGGPTLIEGKTMRMCGHSEHDDASYVPKELFQEWEKLDPVALHERFLLENDYLPEKRKGEIEKKIKDIIDDAVDYAEKSPYPKKEELLDGIFHE